MPGRKIIQDIERKIERRIRIKKKAEETAKMFPGQGIQELGMAKNVSSEIMDNLKKQIGEVLGSYTTSRLWRLISPEALKASAEQQEIMKAELLQTQFAQLAVFLVSYGEWLEISNSENFRMPDFMLGHSLGERTAACASGAISLKDATKFIFYLGGLMQMATILKPGGMRAIIGEIKNKVIESCLKGTDVEIANYNSPKQAVISGGQDGLEVVELRLKARGYRVIKLKVAGAFHNSIYMASLKRKIEEAFDEFGIKIKKPAFSTIWNFTGTPETDPKRIKSFLIEGPVNTVRFQESIDWLIKKGVAKESIQQIGPGQTLTKLLDDFSFPELANQGSA